MSQLNDKQRELITRLWNTARSKGYTLVTFYQDRFYTRKYFGYPICIQLQSEKDIEESHILAWSQSPFVCENMVAAMDAFIAELKAEGAK